MTRDRRNGKFTYSAKFERMCVCGRKLGVHDAEAPHAFSDYALCPDESLPDCEQFIPNKRLSTQQES